MSGWNQERRARQAVLIHNWRPWERATGPKTPEGKARAAMRGYKGGVRSKPWELARALREQREAVDRIR
ncbi:MAG: hypothetical protein RKO66_02095 [Candidatus Contendobacter sp.]|nr:hypothetical protein [Candidatus Contendobacter sp.]MDS4058829.1 hypothetical protein [Candidatus Contendobacter sp.]